MGFFNLKKYEKKIMPLKVIVCKCNQCRLQKRKKKNVQKKMEKYLVFVWLNNLI